MYLYLLRLTLLAIVATYCAIISIMYIYIEQVPVNMLANTATTIIAVCTAVTAEV